MTAPEAAAMLPSAGSTEQSRGLCHQAAPPSQADGRPVLGTPGPAGSTQACCGLAPTLVTHRGWPPCWTQDSAVCTEGPGWPLSQRGLFLSPGALSPRTG